MAWWRSVLPVKTKKKRMPAGIAVTAAGIYAVNGADGRAPQFAWDFCAFDAVSSWQQAVDSVVKTLSLRGRAVTLTLDASFYQSFSIDMPAIPPNEWPTALPFLVKDLLNEPPQQIVAAGLPHLSAKRLQTYVARREQMIDLVVACDAAGISIESIGVEELSLATLASATQHDVILYRQQNGALMLASFIEQQHGLQRRIRSIHGAISGPDITPLELDTLALELQRSLDYLAAQHRDTPVSRLRLRCDGEDNEALAVALSERLNVSVDRLGDGLPTDLPMGGLLALSAAGASSHALNLYSPLLRPRAERLTLNRVALCGGIVAALLATAGIHQEWQYRQLMAQTSTINVQLASSVDRLSRLTAEQAQRQPSAEKKQQVRVLEQRIADKRVALQTITAHDERLRVGYAQVLADLATIHQRDISLQSISITGNALNIDGFAASPEAVPRWVQQFNTRPALMERGFRHFELTRSTSKGVTFALQTLHSEPMAEPFKHEVLQ
ncbi:PilN domain-containing protein [Thaumasiovibrio sp. DFM-14]|uniref:PilN domain-containing protein n=1 Tax=Thaumasiovibrio sp. DFM-14 TaxID=3384792 RepID=UPI00399FF286